MALSKSPEFNAALASMGLTTPLEVLEHLPRRYESFAIPQRKNVYEDKERLVVLGKLRGSLPRPLSVFFTDALSFLF
jgi:hypothetical protein